MDLLKNTANKLFALSLASLAIITAVSELNWLDSDDLNLAKALCVVIFGLGVILYIFWGSAIAWGKTEYKFHISRMKPREMDLSIELSKKLFPSIPTKRELKSLYKANNSICQIQFREIKFFGITLNKPTGLFSALPMNKAARNLLEKEELHGLKFSDKHIIKENRPYTCLYIGAVGAIGPRAKRQILEFLKGFIHAEFKKGVEIIFTRPTTNDGLRVAKASGFIPVLDDVASNELDRLYCLKRIEYENS